MILINGYPIDVAITEDHTFDNTVTENEIEKGANVNDHSRSKSIVLAYEGIVSNAPIGRVRSLRAARANPGLAPVTEAYDALVEIRDANLPVTVEDSLGVFTDMLLTSLTIPRSAGSPDTILRFRVSFLEARFVTNERTFVRVATPAAGKKRNLGTKPTDKDKKPGDTKPERRKSMALRGGKAVSDFLGSPTSFFD